MAVCSEIHTKHINTLSGQNVGLLSSSCSNGGGHHRNMCVVLDQPVESNLKDMHGTHTAKFENVERRYIK